VIAGSAAWADEPLEAVLMLASDASARLVLPYWPEHGWLVRQSGRLAEIALPGARLAIATGAVSLPAGAGAIVGLDTETAAQASYLRLALGCDCTLAVHGDGSRLLIDVVGAEGLAGPVGPVAGPAPRLTRLPPPRRARAAAEPGVQAPDVAETRRRLLDELRRAAEAGLVTLRSDGQGLLARIDGAPPVPEIAAALTPVGAGVSGPEADVQGPGASVARAAEPEAAVAASYAGPPPLAPGGVIEEPPAINAGHPEPTLAQRRTDLVTRAPAPACIENEKFALPDPLPAGAFMREAAGLRRALLGEFDRPDESAALSLARLYLAHGLGAETLAILAEFAPGAAEAPLLAALAWLADERPLPRPNLLAVSGCGGQHALWQAFDAALDGRSAEARALSAAATGALEQAARGMRGRIAVRLGLAAAAEDDWIAAHRLGAMAKRALAPEDAEGHDMRRLLEARHLWARGETEAAVRQLVPLGAARSWAGEQALLELAGIATGPGAADLVALDTLRQDLGAVVTMQRGTELGRAALRAEARVTALLLGREAGFELLAYARSAGLIDESGYHAAIREIGAAMPDREGGAPLAVIYERSPLSFARSLEDAGFRVAVARSYLALGLPGLAERVLQPADLADAGLRRELADAYRELGDAAAAERLAAGSFAGARREPATPGAVGEHGAGGRGPALGLAPPARDEPSTAAPPGAVVPAVDSRLAGRPGVSAAAPPAEVTAPAAEPTGMPPDAVRRLLETVSAEERVLEEMLNDG
jgi:hypothetical protein